MENKPKSKRKSNVDHRVKTGKLIDGKPETVVLNLTARKAVKRFCRECMGFGPYKDVVECSAPLCPLYPFRLNSAPEGVTDEPGN